MTKAAWGKLSASLVRVQKQGTGLENEVRRVLEWSGGTVVYDNRHGYRVQVDAAFPDTAKPQCIVSVTYTRPDQKGHSNENKFQLKIGELILLKGAYPDIRVVMVIGGTEDAWLGYVLNAFQIFFDEVVFLWKEEDRKRLLQIGRDPNTVSLKHCRFWRDVHRERIARPLSPVGTNAPCSAVRYGILDVLKAQKPIVFNPTLIVNPVARLCMRRSFDNGGIEWQNYLKGRWNSIEMSRNFFNPVEACVELTLLNAGVAFQGGVAKDVEVTSLLHDLGMPKTSVSEDFVLFSERLSQPVYIQCKASGGGRRQHGKNIQNRTKEQTTRAILYTSASPDQKQLNWRRKSFHWIAVVDGNWGVTRKEPLKYIHMLEMAGYDKIVAASDLLTRNLSVCEGDNPLADYLVNTLNCTSR